MCWQAIGLSTMEWGSGAAGKRDRQNATKTFK